MTFGFYKCGHAFRPVRTEGWWERAEEAIMSMLVAGWCAKQGERCQRIAGSELGQTIVGRRMSE